MATTLELHHQRLRPRLRPIGLAATAIALVLGTYAVAAFHPAPPAAGNAAGGDVDRSGDLSIVSPAGPAPAATSVAAIDKAIATWTANLTKEPRDFYSATTLGELYEGRARLTGDVGDYDRARQALQQAIATAPTQLAARVVHARVLASLHDFVGALAEAQAILRDDPGQLPALATEGDAELELGNVTAAASAYDALAKAAPGAAVDARLSRLAFIEGRAADASNLANRAFTEATSEGQTGPALSWYAYVVGTLATTAGEPQQALDWFQRARTLWPGSFLAAAGAARAEAGLGDVEAAIADDQAAIAIAPQPDAVAALGDLYALRGETKLADQQYATVEAIAHLATVNAQVFNRQLVLFSVNHGRDLRQALALAQAEIAVRKDAYGYDALAWALLANGRPVDAQSAMDQARAFGTADPLFDYHGGLIAAALGQHDRAIQLLQAALAPVDALDPLATARATAELETLGIGR